MVTQWLATSTDGGATFADTMMGGPFGLRSAPLEHGAYFLGDSRRRLRGSVLPAVLVAVPGSGPSSVYFRPSGEATVGRGAFRWLAAKLTAVARSAGTLAFRHAVQVACAAMENPRLPLATARCSLAPRPRPSRRPRPGQRTAPAATLVRPEAVRRKGERGPQATLGRLVHRTGSRARTSATTATERRVANERLLAYSARPPGRPRGSRT